jgi:hypothetical protein
LKGIHPRLCTQGPHVFNQSAFMLTRSTALLLAAILSMSIMAFTQQVHSE